ncbi:hypothetical protein MTR_4g078765 [Medicago truncatula]|uniref:Uncharacterized protein n=1 Tax=Medicago truncatula TaxID=3880 RepID=A0A072UMU5_MEDTR|nr:hypothetical protein MTR_4g078765 [Medicago truncatula]
MGLEARGVLSKRKRVNFKRVRNGVVSERLNVLVEGRGNEEAELYNQNNSSSGQQKGRITQELPFLSTSNVQNIDESSDKYNILKNIPKNCLPACFWSFRNQIQQLTIRMYSNYPKYKS